MKKMVLCLLLGAVPLPMLGAEPGPGSQFGKRGSVSLSAERLFGFTHAKPSVGNSVTTVSLLGSAGYELAVAPYSIPRVGFDVFPMDGLSLGLGAEFATFDQASRTMRVLGLNPRIGYAVRASDVVSLWPRAGISYMNLDTGEPPPAASTSYLLAATLEVQVVVSPLQHFGFLVGPVVDIGLAATGDHKITQFGFQAGLIGWF